MCSKDYIGVEVQFPKGNKSSAPIKLDGAIFDNKDWFIHYKALHSKKDDTRWDELNWLKEHLLCGIEFKKEDSKDVKGVFNSQLKSYMNESSKNTVFGILYDEGRLYLFKSNGKNYFRLSDEFNTENKGKLAFFAGIDKARFRGQVLPGDTLRLEMEMIKNRGSVGIGKAVAYVGDKRVVTAELTFALSK